MVNSIDIKRANDYNRDISYIVGETVVKQRRQTMKEIIKDLLRPRTLFAFMFYGSMCFLVLTSKEVPDTLNHIVSVLLGFYFGQKIKGGDNGKKITDSSIS